MASQSTVYGNNIVSYLQTYGGDCSQSLASIVSAFQAQYNIDVASGLYAGPAITVDGQYGNDTAAAFTQVFAGTGIATPQALYDVGNSCYGCGIVSGGGTIPAGIVQISSNPKGTCTRYPQGATNAIPGANQTPTTVIVPGGNTTPGTATIPTTVITANPTPTTSTSNTMKMSMKAVWISAGLGLAAGLFTYYGLKRKEEQVTVATTVRSPGHRTRTTRRSVRYS